MKTKMIALKLYVVGKTSASRAVIQRLIEMLRTEFEGRYELTVIDVAEHPELAEKDKIIAAPTLIRVLPLPARRIIGDLADKEKIIAGLDLIEMRKAKQ